MNAVPPLLLVLGLALRFDILCAQTPADISIKVASEGTCEANGFHVSCSEIGTKLKEARIPLNTWITFLGDPTVNSDVMKSTIASLTRAGFENMKIGFITEPAR